MLLSVSATDAEKFCLIFDLVLIAVFGIVAVWAQSLRCRTSRARTTRTTGSPTPAQTQRRRLTGTESTHGASLRINTYRGLTPPECLDPGRGCPSAVAHRNFGLSCRLPSSIGARKRTRKFGPVEREKRECESMMTRRQRRGGDIVVLVPQWLFESAAQPAVVLMVPRAKTLKQIGGRLGTGSYILLLLWLLVIVSFHLALRHACSSPVTCTSHLCRTTVTELRSAALAAASHFSCRVSSFLLGIVVSTHAATKATSRLSSPESASFAAKALPHRVTSVQLDGQRVQFKWQKRFRSALISLNGSSTSCLDCPVPSSRKGTSSPGLTKPTLSRNSIGSVGSLHSSSQSDQDGTASNSRCHRCRHLRGHCCRLLWLPRLRQVASISPTSRGCRAASYSDSNGSPKRWHTSCHPSPLAIFQLDDVWWHRKGEQSQPPWIHLREPLAYCGHGPDGAAPQHVWLWREASRK